MHCCGCYLHRLGDTCDCKVPTFCDEHAAEMIRLARRRKPKSYKGWTP